MTDLHELLEQAKIKEIVRETMREGRHCPSENQNKDTILEEICQFQDWNEIEYILTGIWNRRNLAFRDWLSKLITNK